MEVNVLTRVNSLASDLFQGGATPANKRRRRSTGAAYDLGLPECVARSLVKGVLLGTGLCSALRVLRVLIKGRIRSLTPGQVVTGSDKRFGLFLGSFLATYNSVMWLTGPDRYRGFEPGPLVTRYRALLGGGLAGLSLLLAPKSLRSTIALFFAVRALELQAKMGVRRGLLPRMQHGDALLMVLASAQALWAWIFRPDTLDPNYYRFLNWHGGHDVRIYRSVEAIMRGTPLLPALNVCRGEQGLPPMPLGMQYLKAPELGCELLHPHNSTCAGHFVSEWLAEFKRAIPVYLPVYLVPLLIFNSKAIAKDPVATLLRSSQGVARSAAFLATYCSSAWALLCFFRAVGVRHEKVGIAAISVGWLVGLCGSAVMIEKKGRRIELALYVTTQAATSMWACLVGWGAVKPVKHGEVFLFSLAASSILHAYYRHPHMIRPTYYGLLKRFFDSDLRHETFGRSRSSSSSSSSSPSSSPPTSGAQLESLAE